MVELVDRAWGQVAWPMLMTAAGAAAAAVILPLTVAFDVPVAREVVAFIALFLLPGSLLLSILRIRDLSVWEFLAYACGLSLAILMALGLALNGLHGLGLERPISSVPLTIAVSAMIAALAAVALYRRQLPTITVPLGEVVKPYTLLTMLPLALVVLGAQMVNTRQDNTLLLVAIGMVALLPLAAFVPRLLPERAYPLAVVAIGLTLLLHRSLISPRLTGYDVHAEYFFGNLVLDSGFWETGIENVYNSMLSLVLVPPIFSAVADVDLLWVFKVVYPMLFSLMPLALFLLWRGLLGSRVAFLGICFFMFTQPFYQTMPNQGRMEIALLFLGLLLLSMRVKEGAQAAVLRIIFGTAVVVSHYSVAYFVMPALVVAVGVVQLLRRWVPRTAMAPVDNPQAVPWRRTLRSTMLTPNFTSLFIVLAFFWYIYVSTESATFDDAVRTVSRIGDNLSSDFLSPRASEGLALATQALTPLREVARYIHFLFQFFMVVGVVTALVRWRRGPLPLELVALAPPMLLVNAASILLPYFTATLHLDRIYLLTLIFLAPFAITGALTVFQVLANAPRLCLRALARRPLTLRSFPAATAVLSLPAAGLVLYLLLNTGLVYEITQERPNAIPLSRQWVLANGNADEKVGYLAAYPSDGDFAGGDWLGSHRASGVPIYADLHGWAYVLREWIAREEMESLYPDTVLDGEAYVFLRYLNTQDGIMAPPQEGWESPQGEQWWAFAQLEPQLRPANVIYNNGDSRIYAIRPDAGD